MKLPDREYFTVQELADRWGCSQDDVFEYVKSGKIAPSFKFEYPMCLTETLDEQESRLHYYVENGSHDGYKAEWKTWGNGIKTIDRSDPDSFVLCNSMTYSGIYTLSVDQVMQQWGNAQLSEAWEGNLQGMFFPLPGYEGKQFRIIPVYPFKVTTADFLFLLGEVERFEAECCQEPTAVKSTAAPEQAKRHVITPEERKAKKKSPIQRAVEAYIDATPDGVKAGFYTFLKKQIKLPKAVILKDDQSYAYFFKDVKEEGAREGVYLNNPKEGHKEGDPSWNHYSGNNISSIISKEKLKRKKIQSENSP